MGDSPGSIPVFSVDWLVGVLDALRLEPNLFLQTITKGGENSPPVSAGRLPDPVLLPIPDEPGAVEQAVQLLERALSDPSWNTGLITSLNLPRGRLHISTPSGSLRDDAAFLHLAVRSWPSGHCLVALVPSHLFEMEVSSPLRTSLADTGFVEWLIFLGEGVARATGTHPSFRFTLLVFRPSVLGEASPPIRLVDATKASLAECCEEIRLAARREGGEVRRSIVLRGTKLDAAAWTYVRFSRAFREASEQIRQIGALRSLEEWLVGLELGLSRVATAADQSFPVPDESAPPGVLPCYTGRDISRTGDLSEPRLYLKREAVDGRHMLHAGDVLVRVLRRPGERLVLARVPESALPATFDQTCMRLRFREDLATSLVDLILEYLRSAHVDPWLQASGAGAGPHLPSAVLKRLPVPDPSPEVLAALQRLTEAEHSYREWADEVRGHRADLFASSSLSGSLAALLSRDRLELERLRAARDCDTLDYRIRNYFPHPLALRRDLLLTEEHGKARLLSTLECGEHLLMFVALLCLVQIADGHDVARSLPGGQLPSFCRNGELHLDAGKCAAIIREAVQFTSQQTSPFELPFPELLELQASLEDEDSAWAKSERLLRDERNRWAHLQRLPDPATVDVSRALSSALDVLYEGVGFLASIKLVEVEDYVRDPVSHKRTATFRVLQGSSEVFLRAQLEVEEELPRGAVGMLARDGGFFALGPWLVMERCPRCHRKELFAFNRLEKGEATCVAMESGHPKQQSEVARQLQELIRRTRGSKA
jgi:hypothetical protein